MNLPTHMFGFSLQNNQNMVLPARPCCGPHWNLRIWEKILIIRIISQHLGDVSKVELHNGESENANGQCISRCSGISLYILLQHVYTMPAISPLDLNSNAHLEIWRFFCISRSRMKSVGLLWPPQEHIISICIAIVPFYLKYYIIEFKYLVKI